MADKRKSQRQPHTLDRGNGPEFWVLGLPGQAKSIGEQTGGAYSLVEAHCPQGYATPLHIHYHEDEAIYVLAGHLSVVTGDQTKPVDTGGYVYQPRGIAHGFRVEGDAPARILCLTVPAGADQGPPANTGQPTLLGMAALELEALADLAACYHIDVLGPLPETVKTRSGA
jgi:quercetin dioxygenase-like cupin family protein